MSRVTKIYEKINPKDFEITPEMIAAAAGIPVARIRKIVKKDYVILVHQWHLPSLFVSYRKVSEWLEALERLIRQCGTLVELVGWECRLRQEYKRFSYPQAWVEQLDMAWHRQQWQVVSCYAFNVSAEIEGERGSLGEGERHWGFSGDLKNGELNAR